MPRISERGQKMPASPIRKLVPYADAAKARGVHVHHLNIGQPDIETPDQFMQAIRDYHVETIEYSHSQGMPYVVDKFIEYYKGIGVQLTRENLLVTTGGSEALNFAFLATMNPGDEIIIPEPFYANYNSFTIASGATVVPITTYIENDFDLPEIEEFETLITPKTRAILICNPSNPTGKLYKQESLSKLRDLILKHDLFLIVDEVYREFVYDGEEFISALNLPGVEQNVIVIDSISKRYSACGARIGNLVTYNSDVYSAALKAAQARLSPPTLEQIGAAGVINVSPDYFENVNAEYVSRRDTLVHLLNKIPGILVPKVSGAFYMTVRLPVDNTDDFCQWMLEEFSFMGQTVMMAPGAGFYASPGRGLNEVRLAYVLEEKQLIQAMVCLSEGLKAYAELKAESAAATSN